MREYERVPNYFILVKKINENQPANGYDYNNPELRSILQETTLVFILISCYYAMVLTNWATLQKDSTLNNPKTGTASYWLQAAAQWACLLLYMWSLIAPKLFPDRDFS